MDEKKLKKEYKITRVFVFLIWILCNLGIGYVMSQFRKYNMSIFLLIIVYLLLMFQVIKLLGMIVYRFKLWFCEDTNEIIDTKN